MVSLLYISICMLDCYSNLKGWNIAGSTYTFKRINGSNSSITNFPAFFFCLDDFAPSPSMNSNAQRNWIIIPTVEEEIELILSDN